MKKINSLIACVFALIFTACNYLDVEPIGQVIPQKTSEYRALLTTAYYTFPKHKKLLTLRADEVFPALFTPTYSSNIDLALLNDSGADPSATSYPWQSMYKVIFYLKAFFCCFFLKFFWRNDCNFICCCFFLALCL